MACIVTVVLLWWCHTINSSIIDWLWDRVALPGVVVPNKPLFQPHTEGLEHLLPAGCVRRWLEVLRENEGVHCSTVKEEPEQVFVELPALGPDLVVQTFSGCLPESNLAHAHIAILKHMYAR